MSKSTIIIDKVKEAYLVAILAVLGVFAFTSAVILSYPALAYLASKVMY